MRNLSSLSTSRIVLAGLILISLLAGALIVYATQNGPWGYSDPVAYIVSGRNLVSGIGIGYHFPDGRFHWLAFHPPFFPIISGFFTLLHMDEINTIRVLYIGLFAFSVFAMGYSIYRFTAMPELALLAGLFMAVFPPAVRMYSSAMSEPLFLSTWLLSTLLLLAHLRMGKLKYFIGAAVLSSLALLTRYVGAGWVAAGTAALLFLDRGPWLNRLKKALSFGLISSLPTAFWMVWIYFESGRSLGGRRASLGFTYLLDKFQQFRAGMMDVLMSFVPLHIELPYRWRWVLLGALLLSMIILTWASILRLRTRGLTESERGSLEITVMHGLASAGFVATLCLAYLPSQPPPDIDERTLLPFFPPLALAGIGAVGLWSRAWLTGQRRWLNLLPWLGFALVIVLSLPRSLNRVRAYHEGVGLTADSWRNSPTIQAVKELPQDIRLISNEAPAILLWADRPAYDLRETMRADFISQGGAYGSDAQDASQRAFQEGGALILFNSVTSQLLEAYGEAGPARLEAMLKDFTVYGTYEDGAIYFQHPPTNP